MKKIPKLTIGRKLFLLYLFMFVMGFTLIQTGGRSYIQRLIASKKGVLPLSGQEPNGGTEFLFNELMTLFYLTAAITGLAFFIIYMTNMRALKKIRDGVKNFSITHENPPITLSTHDEYGELAQALNVIGEELSSFEEYQRKFISNISHDFRSPLTSIQGYVQAMADGIIPPKDQEKYLNIILFETRRLTKLTTDLLDVNSFDKNNILLNVSTFDIQEAISNTMDILEGSAKEKNITFVREPADGEPVLVTADSDKIRQVLHNLLDNAVKFSHPSSRIYIRTRIHGNKVFVSVKDTGIGIPKEDISRIWDRFYKTDLSRGKDKLGTGLGLPICREIVNAHRQTIHVVSTAGVGSEFVFTLKKA